MKKIMILILLTIGIFANQIELNKKDIEVAKWMTYAYLEDNKDDMENINYILNSKIFLRKKSSFIIYAIFFSERFKQDDSYLLKNKNNFLKLKGNSKEIILFALKQADTNNSKELYNILLKNLENKDFKKYIQSVKVFDLLNMEITEPSMTDSLWASFMATGRKEYVEKIIEILRKENKGVPNILLVSSAKWSLLSNAEQHEKVFKILKEYKTDNKKIQKEIVEILEKVNTKD